MKKIYNLLIATLLFNLFLNMELIAQDARYTQAYSNPLRINPAIIGINTDLKVIMNYRSQWAAVSNGYKTYSFTGMCPLFFNNGKSKLDIGLSAIGDKAGAFKTFDAALALDYNLEIAPNNILSLALMGGYVQRSLDLSNQTFDHQYVNGSYDADNPTNEFLLNKSESHPDLGFGFMWFLNPDRKTSRLNAFAGISAFHLNKPNETLLSGDAPLPIRFTYQAGVKIFGNNNVDFSPNFRLNVQNGNAEIATGLYMDYAFNDNAKLVLGAWYRTHDAIAVLLGFEHKNFTLGYSYDIVSNTMSKAAPQANAHEITLALKFSRLSKSKSSSFGGEGSISSVRTSPLSSF